MKILNLYAGIGGNRKLWGDEHEITAVEYVPEIAQTYAKLYPSDTLVVADAHQYLLDHYSEFDFIWTSPPCPTHSKMNTAMARDGNEQEDADESALVSFTALAEQTANKRVVEELMAEVAFLDELYAEIPSDAPIRYFALRNRIEGRSLALYERIQALQSTPPKLEADAKEGV